MMAMFHVGRDSRFSWVAHKADTCKSGGSATKRSHHSTNESGLDYEDQPQEVRILKEKDPKGATSEGVDGEDE